MRWKRAAGLLALLAMAVGSVAAGTAGAGGDQAGGRLSATLTVAPSKAGTTRDPQGVLLGTTGTIATAPGDEPPVVTGFDLLIGRGLHWNGGSYPACSKHVLERKGPDGCPRESRAGTGVAGARAGDVETEMEIAFFNGGEHRLLASIRFDYPARVRETIAIEATESPGPWPYRYRLRVPRSLQVVAGVPIQTTGLRLALGGKPYAKQLIASTSCPRGGWKYRLVALYRQSDRGPAARDATAGSIACTS